MKLLNNIISCFSKAEGRGAAAADDADDRRDGKDFQSPRKGWFEKMAGLGASTVPRLPLSNTTNTGSSCNKVLTIYDAEHRPVANVMRPWADRDIFYSCKGDYSTWKATTHKVALSYCDYIIRAVNSHETLAAALTEIARMNPNSKTFARDARAVARNAIEKMGGRNV